MKSTINTAELVKMMANIKGATICTIDAVTEPKMNKRGNPYIGRVLKLTRVQLQFGYDYERAVNNRLKAQGLEPNFKAESRSWGEWIIPNKVAYHKGEFYFRFYTMENENSVCEVYYLIDGRLATKSEVEELKAFMPRESESNTQSGAGLTEHQVKPREYKASAIRKIAVNGDVYEIAKSVESIA